jgi:hypothetical protein
VVFIQVKLTNTLTITNATLSLDNNLYRLLLQPLTNVCINILSSGGRLRVNAAPVAVNRAITQLPKTHAVTLLPLTGINLMERANDT